MRWGCTGAIMGTYSELVMSRLGLFIAGFTRQINVNEEIDISPKSPCPLHTLSPCISNKDETNAWSICRQSKYITTVNLMRYKHAVKLFKLTIRFLGHLWHESFSSLYADQNHNTWVETVSCGIQGVGVGRRYISYVLDKKYMSCPHVQVEIQDVLAKAKTISLPICVFTLC